MTARKRGMRFGFCYFPQITRIEDFYPFWVIDNWNEEGVRTDFSIMKALGCDCIRIHMTPPVPGAICFDRWNIADRRAVPVTAGKYTRMLDFEVKLAKEKGFSIHFDIGSTFDELTENSVVGWVGRYKGVVESYQFANENYGAFAADRSRLKRLQRFCELGKQIDPRARFAMDLTSKEVAIIRKDFPKLFRLLNPILTHGWFYTDQRGWSEDTLNQLIATHSGKKMPKRRELLPNFLFDPDVDFGKYEGIADFGKPIWITEIVGAGTGPFSGFVPEEQQASDWQRVMECLHKSCPGVERIYHCWFSDKLHYFGLGHRRSSVVAYDGTPKETAEAFLASTRNYGTYGQQPVQSKNIPVVISSRAGKARLEWKLENKSAEDIKASLTFISSSGVQISRKPRTLQIPANSEKSFAVEVEVKKSAAPTNHIFSSIKTKHGIVELWGVIRCPRRIKVHKKIKPLEGVYWRPSPGSVEDFLQKYAKDCAVVFGSGRYWNGFDMEMASRIQAILSSLTAVSLPSVAWYDLRQVWDQPLIVVGGPKWNFVAQILELSVPSECKVQSLAKGEGEICVIEKPFGSGMDQLFALNSPVQLVGLRQCPAALYIAGIDAAGTMKCASDLLRRIKSEPPELFDPSSRQAWTLPPGTQPVWNM